ncbi:hypothetical protein [Legionella sp. CNM-4043-24]|uniref:hypothetical protein n=1 Tax=Legionella sp. CNM-4043-24 TaxID=3421646 RepID=UPI00403AF13A
MKEKVSPDQLITWLVLLRSNSTGRIPASLQEIFKAYDFSDVFPDYAAFIDFYKELQSTQRLPFALCLSPDLLKKLLHGHPLLHFFKTWHSPEEALRLLNFASFDYDGSEDSLETLLNWLSWFSGHERNLPKPIRSSMVKVINKVSLSAFLEEFKGNPVEFIRAFDVCFKGDWTALKITNIGRIRLVLERLQDDASNPSSFLRLRRKELFTCLFQDYRQKYQECYSEDEIRSMITSLELQNILLYPAILDAIQEEPAWLATLAKRLLHLHVLDLSYLLRETQHKSSVPVHLLEILVRQHREGERLKQSMIRFFTVFKLDSAITRYRFESLDAFQNSYTRLARKERPDFLNLVEAAAFEEMLNRHQGGWQSFFRHLHSIEDTCFIEHQLFSLMTKTPQEMAWFMNVYKDSPLITKLFFGHDIRFKRNLERNGGVAEFLRHFEGDFLGLLKRTQTPLGWLNLSVGNVFEVHQQLKTNVDANIVLTRWILRNPEYLHRYYNADALFDVLRRLPEAVLLGYLTTYQSIIVNRETPERSYEGMLHHLLLIRGCSPSISRCLYDCYYPDLRHPFWKQDNTRLALFAFLETPEIMNHFIARVGDTSNLLALETLIKSTLAPIWPALQEYDEHVKDAEKMIFFMQLLFAHGMGINEKDSRVSLTFLLYLFLLIPAVMGKITAVGHDYLVLLPRRTSIRTLLPAYFPDIAPDQLLRQASLLFETCQKIRMAQQQVRFFSTQSEAASSVEPDMVARP